MSDHPLSTVRPMSRIAIRSDASGDGRYGASRRGADKSRYAHQGIDLLAPAGEPVVSPVDGIIDISKAYTDPAKSEYKIVSVTTDARRYRFFYVAPDNHDGTSIVRGGDRITAGRQIGIVQNIAKTDATKRMGNHVHFAISTETDRTRKPNYIDPTPQVDEWMRTPGRFTLEPAQAPAETGFVGT